VNTITPQIPGKALVMLLALGIGDAASDSAYVGVRTHDIMCGKLGDGRSGHLGTLPGLRKSDSDFKVTKHCALW
jgi:hypothetical protein